MHMKLDRHMYNVAILSKLLGSFYGLEDHELSYLELAARLHDIGKYMISDKLLLAKRKLTLAEFDVIKNHSILGANLLKKYGFNDKVVCAVRHHHEWWNGNGYPDGIKGESIPLYSRIIAITDAFDAMVSGRPYKNCVAYRLALEELYNCSGVQFDPQLVKLYLKLFLEEVTEISI